MFFNVPKALPSLQKRFSSFRKLFQATKNIFHRFKNFSKFLKTFFNASKTLQSPQKRFSTLRRTGGGRPFLSFNIGFKITAIINIVLHVNVLEKRRGAHLINNTIPSGIPLPSVIALKTTNAHAPDECELAAFGYHAFLCLWYFDGIAKNCWLSFPKISIAKIQEIFQTMQPTAVKLHKSALFFMFFIV